MFVIGGILLIAFSALLGLSKKTFRQAILMSNAGIAAIILGVGLEIIKAIRVS